MMKEQLRRAYDNLHTHRNFYGGRHHDWRPIEETNEIPTFTSVMPYLTNEEITELKEEFVNAIFGQDRNNVMGMSPLDFFETVQYYYRIYRNGEVTPYLKDEVDPKSNMVELIKKAIKKYNEANE